MISDLNHLASGDRSPLVEDGAELANAANFARQDVKLVQEALSLPEAVMDLSKALRTIWP